MSASTYSSLSSNVHEHDDKDSILMPTIAKRRVQIPQIPHSTTVSSDTLVQQHQQHQQQQQGQSGSAAGGRQNAAALNGLESGSATELPPAYEIPSASNGGSMGLRASASMPLRSSEPSEGRKSTGIRAALVNKFSTKKKELQASPSLSSKRQQLQLESLIMQSKSTDDFGSGAPTVRGHPVGHPMAFQHVEHLSPTVVGPKMSLINSPDLYKSYTQPAKSTPPQQQLSERKSTFRSLNPAALLSKTTKSQSQASSGKTDPSKTVVTVRGKPIGAPTEFQHVEHLSAADIMKNYQVHNQRQQHAEIMSVLYKPSSAGAERAKMFQTASERTQKTTYRGLPLSGPVTFEHVEHISVKDYKMHIANSKTLEPQNVAPMGVSESRGSSSGVASTLSAAEDSEQAASASGSQHQQSQQYQQQQQQSLGQRKGPRLASLQHTSAQQNQQTTQSGEQQTRPPSQSQSQKQGQQQQQPSSINKLLLAHQKKMRELEEQEYENVMQSQNQEQSDDDAYGQTDDEQKASYGMIGGAKIKGLLAKAGISKARQISSPFNVQHDVHISVEDLDDLMQQVPDTWKPYISPVQSPRSATGPASSHESDSQQSVPAATRHSADSAEALAEQMSRSSMAEEGASRTNKGPGSPNWLPQIVSVSSPQDGAEARGAPSPKQRSVSGQSENNGWDDQRAARMSCMSVAAEQLEMTTVRVPMPLSAVANASMPRLVDASMLRRSPGAEKPALDQTASSAAYRSTSPQSNSDPAMDTSEPQTSMAHGDKSNKWIKRKSRVISTHAMAMAHKRFSKIGGPMPLGATPEGDEAEDETSVEPSAPVYPSDMADPNAKILDAAAEAAAKAAAAVKAMEATADVAEQPGMLQSQDSVRSLEKSAGTVSGKSSKKRRENYGELEEYAEGDSGNVYITVRNTAVGRRPRGEYVAVKVVPKSAKARYRKLRTELKILRRIRSQHVVRFYEYFSIDDAVWIVYEFMSRGSVTDLLAGYPEVRMPAVIISYTMHEVLTALAYLHERHIIHCDVRSDNVLIDDRGQVKLADFSSAVYLDVDQQSAQKTSLGAIYWMAPELAKGAGYSPSTDVWAAGALVYEMLEGQPPYIEYPDIKVLELSNANGMPKLSDPDACDAGLVELMRLCTTINPAERQPASRLRKHESVLSPDAAQCAQLMVDFVLQVESLAGEDEEEEGEVGE